MTEWGPEIRVDGVRPDWLEDGQEIHWHWKDGSRGDWKVRDFEPSEWPHCRAIRLPADHPHYNKVFLGAIASTPSGKNGSYYDITINGQTISCNDVIDALGLNFNHGELFKAAWRLGKKPGTSATYDLDKIIYFANRERAKCQ